MPKRPSRQDWANHLAVHAPPDMDRSTLPEWMTAKPRSDAGKKRGPQGETTWLHSIIKPFKSFVRYAWPAGSLWLARNNNGLYRALYSDAKIRGGLGTGTSDAVGLTCVLITPEMVGTVMAQFTVFEAKSDDGVLSEAQELFAKNMRAAGARVLVGSPSEPPIL